MTRQQEAFSLLDAFIESQRQAACIPGLALAATDREQLIHLTTAGFADQAAQTPVTPSCLFEIGSISKSFTAIALLQLHEAGRLELHRPVNEYLPWFHVPSRYGPITPHHLLSHTGGIICGTEFTTEARYEVWALRETEATAPPGVFFHYSNVGYKVLGLILETILEQDYGEIIRERILDPLEMSDTEPAITHEIRKRMAVGYEPLYDDRPPHPSHPLIPATWLETGTADGSIASTAEDMARYLRMLLKRGQGPRKRLLSEEAFALMSQRLIEPGDEEHGAFYGYGLVIEQEEGHMVIGHSGGMVGYYSSMLADMDEGLGVIVLINGPGKPTDIARFALRLLRAARHGQPLPSLPLLPDPTRIQNAAEYCGTYRSEGESFALTDEDGQLILHYRGERVPLEQRGTDCFYVAHPHFAHFLLRFGRQGGEVVEAFHGPWWAVNERYSGPISFDHPPEWEAYPGHYRAHNPWFSNFRIVLRKGQLWLIAPQGEEQPLVELGDGVFRVGMDERSPERIRFDTLINGQAVRATLSCCPYYRTFTA